MKHRVNGFFVFSIRRENKHSKLLFKIIIFLHDFFVDIKGLISSINRIFQKVENQFKNPCISKRKK
jgi:hypothetical protein